jgi:putative toxin-antitoxin system antitoxin component (TIGR02293 family)
LSGDECKNVAIMAKYIKTDTPPPVAAEPAVAYHASTPTFLDMVRRGVPRQRATDVQAGLGLSQNIMASLLHMSERTLQRYDNEDLMDAPTSEKVLLLDKLRVHGVRVFGDEHTFTAWLNDEIPSLGYKKPISFLDTFTGIQTIDQTLGRLEWGMF